jgi:uncharacterized membrane protein YqhA
VSGVIAVASAAWHALRYPRTDVAEAKHMAVDFIELIDVFLLGTVLYIIALGLYELFVDPALPMPGWLKIRDLDELKERVIIVLLGVTFLGSAVTWQGQDGFLGFGVAIAAVIGVLGLVLWITGHRHRQHDGGNGPFVVRSAP